MRVISLVGNVDKRILTLNMARGLSFLGETLVITDDPNYLRGTDKNIIGAVKVLFSIDITDNTFRKINDGVDYINVIYDTREFIPSQYDKLIACRGKDRTLLADRIKNHTDDIDKNGDIVNPSTEVVITYFFDKKELKKAHYTERGEHEDVLGKADIIELKPSDMKWLMFCEETADISVLKNPALISEIAKITCEAVGMSQKEWEAVLNRV